MFEKFGEFDSVEELNRAAAAQKAENDEDALIALALENGLTREDAEDYMDGCTDTLATDLQAALGKIRVEDDSLEIDGIMKDWKNAVIDLCTEDVALRAAVRRKEKSLCACMAALIKFSFENKVQVSDKIVDACKVKHNGKLEPMRGPLYLGVPDRAAAQQVIMGYYLGQEAEG
jgi:hypothetical protein